jgi:hypothetical protein
MNAASHPSRSNETGERKMMILQSRTVAAALLISGVVGSVTSLAETSPSQSTSKSETAGEPAGLHDFDFLYGKWRMPNHRLMKRLAGSHEWVDFISCDEASALPGGVGDIDYYKASYWKDFMGVTVRTYDPKTGLWRIYWVDNRFSEGVIQPPVVGKFNGNVGIFEGPDTFNGIPIIVRYTWTLNPQRAPAAAKWEQALNPQGAPVVATWAQAFSTDGGKTWETNWYNEIIHDDNCKPTS